MPIHSPSAVAIHLSRSWLLAAALTGAAVAAHGTTAPGPAEAATSPSRVADETAQVITIPAWKVGDKAIYRMDHLVVDYPDGERPRKSQSFNATLDVEVLSRTDDGSAVHRWRLVVDPVPANAAPGASGERPVLAMSAPRIFDVGVSPGGGPLRVIDLQAMLDIQRQEMERDIMKNLPPKNDNERELVKLFLDFELNPQRQEAQLLDLVSWLYLSGSRELQGGVAPAAPAQVTLAGLDVRTLDGARGQRVDLSIGEGTAVISHFEATSHLHADETFALVNAQVAAGRSSNSDQRRQGFVERAALTDRDQDQTTNAYGRMELDDRHAWPSAVVVHQMSAGLVEGILEKERLSRVRETRYRRIDEATVAP